MKRILMLLIYGYRTIISPMKPCSCRFLPTCSEYALDALTHYGVMRGSWLTFRRLLRCHPFCNGGYDPLPIHLGTLPSTQELP